MKPVLGNSLAFFITCIWVKFYQSFHSLIYSADITITVCWINEFLKVYFTLRILTVKTDRSKSLSSKISQWVRGEKHVKDVWRTMRQTLNMIWEHKWGLPHPDWVNRKGRVRESLIIGDGRKVMCARGGLWQRPSREKK